MIHLAAKEAKTSFGKLLDTVQKDPVLIQKNGRPVAVVLSVEEYERLENLEEQWWAYKAEQASQEGMLGPQESQKLLKDLLSAAD